jgi:hypothetical protein
MIDPTHSAYVPFLYRDNGDVPLESVEVLSDYIVIFTFSKAFSPFITSQASTVELFSPNSFQGQNISHPIGTGPYKFVQYINNTDYVIANLTRNNDYFRGLPPFEQVHFTYAKDEKERNWENYNDALIEREVDLAYGGASLIAEDSEYWNLFSTGVAIIRLGLFNHQREEFANRKVRLAINYAINKVEYMNQLFPGYYGEFWRDFAAKSIFPYFLRYWDNTIDGYPYNVSKANELLDEAGYFRDIYGYRFDLEIPVFSGDTPDEVLLLVGYLDAIGINCTITVPPFFDPMSIFDSGDYGMAFNLPRPDFHDPSFMSRLLHSNGSLNTGGYSNPLVDSLLDLSVASPVDQEREFYYRQVQNISQVEAPYLLLPESPSYIPLANHVKSFVKLQKNRRPSFNFSSAFPSQKISYSDILISSKSIYFPFTDAIVTQSDSQSFDLNLTMSYELETFFPSFQETGKFYQLSSEQEGINYRFRCYYDPSEISDFSSVRLYSYTQKTNSWSSLDIVSSNRSLRYIEVELSGGSHFLSFDKKIILTVYKLLPIISLLFGSVLIFAILVLFYNQKMLNQLKRRHRL